MSLGEHFDVTELKRRLDRDSEQMREVTFVASPGARVASLATKVKGLSSYNVYNVCVVEMGSIGDEPVEIGEQMEAVNLAESFTENGLLSEGTYVIVSRIGEKYAFYAAT